MKKAITIAAFLLILAVGKANATIVADSNTFTSSRSTPYSLTLNSFNSVLGAFTEISMSTSNLTQAVPKLPDASAASGGTVNLTSDSAKSTESSFSKTSGNKAEGDKTNGDKSNGDKSNGDKSNGDKSNGDKSNGDKSTSNHYSSTCWNRFLGIDSLRIQNSHDHHFNDKVVWWQSNDSRGKNDWDKDKWWLSKDNNGKFSWGKDKWHNCPGTDPTPIPAAAWLLGSGLMGLMGIRKRKNLIRISMSGN